MDLRYSRQGCHGPKETGLARTIDLSSSGLSFTSDKPLAVGEALEVSLDWPVLLNGATRLQLVLSGVVVRSNGTVVGLQIHKHDFRTHRERLSYAAASP
jgi:hypothetical protein